MSRWLPIPCSVASSIEIAGLSPSARCAWVALRVAHAAHGQGGVLPSRIGTAVGLPLVAPALVAGIDLDVALVELSRAGLIRLDDDGLALGDWDPESEQAPCTSCRRRNPDPRHHRCPACRARDTDPTRRASRKRGADVAQTAGALDERRASQHSQGLAGDAETKAQTKHSARADVARPRPDPTLPDRPDPIHQTRACAREAPASPAGEPIRPQSAPAARQQQSLVAIGSAWAVVMAKRGIERMLPAIHAGDVVRLQTDFGTEPTHVHDAEALARDRRDFAKRLIAWCPEPERLARCFVVAALHYGAQNVAAYLRKAAASGDPGTMLSRHQQGEGVLGAEAERALRGERVVDVAELVAGVAAVHDARLTGAQRDQLRAELAQHMRHGHVEAARRVLVQLVGPDRSDVAVARAIGHACTLAEARSVLGGAA
ncbi:MAG: hypothetical protein ACK52I_11750 [Pseudomonadota bacterium]|jgi:hypothetical protein